ncbi:MAG TPA: acetyl-CoA C-acetyltransferase, partial [Chitinolyticbacter sp.]|nr:acetyl-CoA C-acetyltransferase [Chitinolyticbacter sp.]
MSHAYIVSPLRTPIGKFGGSLASLPAAQLAAAVMRAVLERAALPAELIDEVIVAQGYSSSEAPCMGRYAASLVGLPDSVAGYSVDRRCGSGLQAVIDAAMQIQTGVADCLLVAGVESMSNIEYYSTSMRWGSRLGDVTMHDRLDRGRVNSQPISVYGECKGGAVETAENLVRDYGISREDCDRWAVGSHHKAAAAWREGRFDKEVLPIEVPQRKGAPLIFSRDEGFREDASYEAMAKLPAILSDGTVTAGSASQQNDAAAGCLVVSERFLKEHN